MTAHTPSAAAARRRRPATVLTVTVLLAALAACSPGPPQGDPGRTVVHSAGAQRPSAPATAGISVHDNATQDGYRGFRLNMPLPRPRFALTDTAGHRYDFASRTHGRVTLLYFGYTLCPDQCPTTMADIAVALRGLSADVRSRVIVVFVTTDPRRDTPAVLGSWLRRFDPSFVGLTGSAHGVTLAQNAASVSVSTPTAEVAKPGPASTAHGGGVLVYTCDDYAHFTYPAGTTVEDLVHDLPVLVWCAGQHGDTVR